MTTDYANTINAHNDPCDPAYGAAQGIHWAIMSARVPGTTHEAFTRHMSADQIEAVISRIVADGIYTMDRVPYWLNEHHAEWQTV